MIAINSATGRPKGQPQANTEVQFFIRIAVTPGSDEDPDDVVLMAQLFDGVGRQVRASMCSVVWDGCITTTNTPIAATCC